MQRVSTLVSSLLMVFTLLAVWVLEGETSVDFSQLGKLLTPLLLLFGLLLVWDYQLKRRAKRQTRQLTEISALQGAILDNASYAIIATDVMGTVTVFNRAAEEMLGYQAEEVVGLRSAETFLVAEEVQQHAEAFAAQHNGEVSSGFAALVQPSVYGQSNEHKYTFVRKDGTLLPVQLSISVMWEEHERETGFLAIAIDISEQLKHQQQLKRAKESAEKASHAKDEFLASMSHELRTPLTAIIGNCRILLDGSHGDETREMLHSIHAAGETQLALVNDIIDLSKIDSGKFTIEQHPFDLAKLLSEVEQMLEVKASDAGLEWVVQQHNGEEYQLIGDSQRIKQILINLADNAIKFTEHGSVQLSSDVEDKSLLFQVVDSGIGIPVEVQEQLFSRFQQADGSISRKFGGSGLGLYICRSLTELMGGTISVTSEPGRGSTFEVRLPYQQSERKVREQANAGVRSLTRLQFSGKVLIAEDTVMLQKLEAYILKSLGVSVKVANNGREAVEMANTEPFDLILMDMQMPEVDGIAATRILREQGHETPIVALTANVMQKHRDIFHEAGGNDFITKPIDENTLRKVLRNYLPESEVEEKVEVHEEQTEMVQQDASALSGLPEELRNTLLTEFFDRIAELSDEIQTAADAENWEKVRELSHVVKGGGGSYGFPQLSKQGAMVCQGFDSGELEKLPAQVPVLLQEIERTLHCRADFG